MMTFKSIPLPSPENARSWMVHRLPKLTLADVGNKSVHHGAVQRAQACLVSKDCNGLVAALKVLRDTGCPCMYARGSAASWDILIDSLESKGL